MPYMVIVYMVIVYILGKTFWLTVFNIQFVFSLPIGPQTGASYPGKTTGSSGKLGGTDCCPRCGGAVYMAEKIVGAGSVSCVMSHFIMGYPVYYL